MLGYYYYTTKVRRYLVEEERASYTFAITTFLVIAAFAVLLFGPLLASTINAYNQLKRGEEYETEITEKIVALGEAKRNFTQIVPQLGTLEKDVPKGTSQSSLVEDLYSDANQSQTIVTSIQFPQTEDEAIGQTLFTLYATTFEETFETFLENLEKGRLLSIVTLQASTRDDEGQTLWDVTLNAEALYIP